MSVVSVNPRSFILALFIRDDGERFLLGDKGYDFKDSQLHFAANTIENDEVMKQGADGVMVAGQVRRASVQSFDGFVGDATMAKETIEQMRRDFFAFFVKGHHFRVIYVDCNRNAWQRKGGYLVDAPEVKELWQIHPEYHVGLNFEDVNYYSYDEDADGEEILSNLVDVPVSTAASGGLVWDEDGAVSEDAEVEYISETAVATPAKNVYITDAVEAPLASFQLDGETSQNGTPTPSAPVPVQTVTGENVVEICGKNLWGGTIELGGVRIGTGNDDASTDRVRTKGYVSVEANTEYAISGIAGSRYTLFYDSNKSYLGYAQATLRTTQGSFTTVQNTRYVRWYVIPYGTSPDTSIKEQLELGSTATAYEPYQGQSYEINLGKNLFDKDNVVIGKVWNGNSNAKRAYGYIEAIQGQQYTVSTQNTDTDLSLSVVETTTIGSGTSPIKQTTLNEALTFTPQASTKYIAVQFATTNATMSQTIVDNAKVQIELGSTATSYAPYFTPIELCKIGDYQDYIYKSGGKWYKHKVVDKLVLTGSESNYTTRSNTSTTHSKFRINSNVLSAPIATTTSIRCTNFVANAGANAQAYSGNAICGSVTANFERQLWFSIDNTIASTVDAFKTWVTNNTPTVYYALATATDTEITNEALIAQLEAVLGGRTYAGTNNITTITPNEQGTLEISYYTKYQPVVVGGGYVWEAGGSGGATVVVNNSIDNVSPIWKIYGPTTNPQLENSTTGEVIEYVGVIAEGQTLTIDMGEQTASLDGLNVISNLVGDFISLAPGANRLIYSVLGDAGASSIGWSEIVG